MSDAHDSPRNPTVAFERTDVNARGIVVFAIGLVAGIAATMVVIFVAYWRMQDAETRRKSGDLPVAQDARRRFAATDPARLLPPSPRLEGVATMTPDRLVGRLQPTDDPTDDLGRIRPGVAKRYYESQARILNDTWEWADKDHAAAHIPVDAAMRLLLARPSTVFKARNQDKYPDEPVPQPSRSNSGRGEGEKR
jgi:hypothetical protein